MPDKTYLTGLIGEYLEGSLSPALHNAGFAALGVDGEYRPIDTIARNESLPTLLEKMRADGFDGFNVTHPYKTAILPLLDDIATDAKAVGAVNTVVVADDKLVGHNTDWLGFAAQFHTLETSGPALVLGAGGAGRAVVYALQKAGVLDIRLFDPDIVAAQKLAAIDRAISVVARMEDAVRDATCIVNASTVGMYGKGGLPLDGDLVRAKHKIADVVYFPVETPLVLHARTLGCHVATGDIMCFEQAVAGFEIMTGLTADRTGMADSFAGLLSAAA